MSKVLSRVMTIVFIIYIVLGFFGYVTFANDTEQLASGNILYANYNNKPIITVVIMILMIEFNIIGYNATGNIRYIYHAFMHKTS